MSLISRFRIRAAACYVLLAASALSFTSCREQKNKEIAPTSPEAALPSDAPGSAAQQAAPGDADAPRQENTPAAVAARMKAIWTALTAGQPRNRKSLEGERSYDAWLAHYKDTLPRELLTEAILFISHTPEPDAADRAVLGQLLLHEDKASLLALLRQMYYIPRHVRQCPLSVHLYRSGIRAEELQALLESEADLHPDAIGAIAVFIHEYRFGVRMASQPLSDKLPLSEAAQP